MLTLNWLIKTIRTLSQIGKWIALAAMTLMMLFITYAVVNREFFTPVVGDVELVRLGMVVLIMFGLAYSQAEDAHISIGLLVDRFPERVQNIIDAIAFLTTFVVCLIIGWVTFGIAFEEMLGHPRSTDLLEIPYYPFRFVIGVGFILWSLEALLKVVQSISQVSNPTAKEKNTASSMDNTI